MDFSVVRVSGVPVVSELNIYYKELCLFNFFFRKREKLQNMVYLVCKNSTYGETFTMIECFPFLY